MKNGLVAFWGCIVCSQVHLAHGNHRVMFAWLGLAAVAFVLAVLEKTTQKGPQC